MSRAARDAALQFAPQRRGLMEALQQARETYGSTVRAGNTTAKLTEQAAARALPSIQSIYGKADAGQQAGVTLVNQQLAGLGGDANQYKANQASEVQQQLANLLGSRARDEGILTTAGTQARAGAQFNQANARQVLQQTLKGLLSKGSAINEEQGATAASEAEKLAGEADKEAAAERRSERTANTSRANSQESSATSAANSSRSAATTRRGQNLTRQSAAEAHHNAGGGGADFTAPGVKRLTADQHNSARDQIETIRHEAYEQRTASPRLNFNHAKLYLETPVKGVHAAYPNNGKLKAGLELAYFGGLSDGTIKQLHREGLSVKELNYPRFRKVNGVPRLEKL